MSTRGIMNYNVQAVEKKWQKQWQENPIGQTKPTGHGTKYYCLDMFPYPSGSGLHVGHWRGYVLSDIYARIKWLQGYNVLHPMGWDAFGLPAENDAIKKGMHPQVNTDANIANFKRQLEQTGCMYDWSKEVNTTDPDFYKWTQWIFIQMFKAGLAYQEEVAINWCPSCLTGLANEEVVNGSCERCGAPVEQRNIRQWILRITNYAQKLLDGLDTLEWPEKVKMMQRHWIGRSEGARINFTACSTKGNDVTLPVFTTRADTLYGVTFLAMAPDHHLADSIVLPEHVHEVQEYRKITDHLSPFERTLQKEKTGVFTGSFAVNPINNERLPIYLTNYVLKDYGTGIVMGVPAHCERDFDFAKKYNIPLKQVISSPLIEYDDEGNLIRGYEGDGTLINSGQFNGLDAFKQGIAAITNFLVDKGLAERTITYKLRDWIFSRQRYWGEPIPVVHCQKCGVVAVPENQLPIRLPDVDRYQPTGTGESPLAALTDWVNTTCPECGGPAKRETNTMPQWAGSCWYFLRYPNPTLKDKPFSQEDINYWLPVDLYVGGIEHAILHLLYARFWIKVLHDLGYLPFNEPFTHLFNQGMITKYSEKTGFVEKMSKSKGNVVNPDDIITWYGSDALRMYMLFMGPPELDAEWQDSGLEGIKRFLNRLWNYLQDPEHRVQEGHQDVAVTKRFHRFLKEYQERIDHFKPNTAVSAAMEFLNELYEKQMKLAPSTLEQFIVALSIMIPFMASELLETLCNKTLQECTWPTVDEKMAQVDELEMVVQVNGKLRAHFMCAPGTGQGIIQKEAEKLIAPWLEGKNIVKVIFVPDRLINFVVK
ncbi:MAG: leucine--tRNA ligase [Candidatus Babeliales bacterium]